MADEIQVRMVTDDDIGLKVLYEPPPEARGASLTPSVEYDSRTHPRCFIPPTLTALLQHCGHPWDRRPPRRYLVQEDRHGRPVRVLRQLAERHTHAAGGSSGCSDHEIRISVAMVRGRSRQSEGFDTGSASSPKPPAGSKGTFRPTGGMPNQD